MELRIDQMNYIDQTIHTEDCCGDRWIVYFTDDSGRKLVGMDDIKLLGLLKTIGMTKPQIKKLVHLESLAVALPAIIVGDIVGILFVNFESLYFSFYFVNILLL